MERDSEAIRDGGENTIFSLNQTQILQENLRKMKSHPQTMCRRFLGNMFDLADAQQCDPTAPLPMNLLHTHSNL